MPPGRLAFTRMVGEISSLKVVIKVGISRAMVEMIEVGGPHTSLLMHQCLIPLEIRDPRRSSHSMESSLIRGVVT